MLLKGTHLKRLNQSQETVVTENPTSNFFRHLFYVLGSQTIVLVSGVIKALVIPILLGVTDYGYWQIYIFYTLYIGIFTFGYGDGLYLRYGGFNFNDLPFPRIRFANSIYFSLLIVSAIALIVFASLNSDPNRKFVFFAVAANVIILGLVSNISLTLQATNLLKGYAFLNSADKVFFSLALLALFSEDFQVFEYLVVVDLVAKIMVMVMLLYQYRRLYFGSLAVVADGIKEFRDSVGSGVQLLLANISGMLVLGMGRIIVEYYGELDSYAYYAFATSLASVVLMSVTALSIVIYPTLRRQPQDHYANYFGKTNRAYLLFTMLMLTGYFPAMAFINLVAKEYGPVTDFLNAMFVVTVLQGKMQLVNNTYYKALRLERQMLLANATSLIVATGLSFVSFSLTHSILAIAYSTLATMLFRVYASEIFLRRQMKSAPDRYLVMEVLTLCFFLLMTFFFGYLEGAGIWLVFILTIALFNRVEMAMLWQKFRGIM